MNAAHKYENGSAGLKMENDMRKAGYYWVLINGGEAWCYVEDWAVLRWCEILNEFQHGNMGVDPDDIIEIDEERLDPPWFRGRQIREGIPSKPKQSVKSKVCACAIVGIGLLLVMLSFYGG